MSDDVHSLSGAYALDAVDPAESARFEAHLEGCSVCRLETQELREAVSAMGGQAWAIPPARLRESVLAAAERTPQQPPGPRSGSEPTAASAPVVTPIASRRRRPVVLLAAAAAVVAVLAGGLVGLRTLGADETERELVAAARVVFDAQDAEQTAVTTANGGSLRVAVSRTREEMAVDTRDLPDLDPDHVYQLWTVHDGFMRSRAILGGEASGAAMAVPSEGTQVALTVEPEGGSQQPTTKPIVTVDPTAI